MPIKATNTITGETLMLRDSAIRGWRDDAYHEAALAWSVCWDSIKLERIATVGLIDTNATTDQNREQMIALELATGSSLPENVQDWPLGLVLSWNTAAELGALTGCATLGDMARAFLRHRIERLNAGKH